MVDIRAILYKIKLVFSHVEISKFTDAVNYFTVKHLVLKVRELCLNNLLS